MDTINIATIIGIAVIFVLVILNIVYAFKICKYKRNAVKAEHKPNKGTEESKEEKPKRKQRKSLLSRLHKKPESSSNIWK